MSGAETGGDIAIVFAALVGIADWEAIGVPVVCLQIRRRDFDLVGFATLGNVAAGAGFATVKGHMDIRFSILIPGGQPSMIQPSLRRGFRRKW